MATPIGIQQWAGTDLPATGWTGPSIGAIMSAWPMISAWAPPGALLFARGLRTEAAGCGSPLLLVGDLHRLGLILQHLDQRR